MRHIDADALKEYICTICDNRERCEDREQVCSLIADIDEQPTIEAEPAVHGHWIKGHCGVDEYIKCSVCRTRIVNTIVSLEGDAAEDYFDLCPKCGARMDGENT